MDRPVAVACSTTPKITASTMKIATDQGMFVCGTAVTPMEVKGQAPRGHRGGVAPHRL